MRLVRKETIDGKDVLTVGTSFLWWESVRQYEAQRESPPGYWSWLKLPNRMLVGDALSFQLDAWNRLGVTPRHPTPSKSDENEG